jgi:alpha-L-fucosidase 2
MSQHLLWYRAPATVWTEALPVGNGRLGAMVFGGTARERLQINEDTLWAGGPYSQVNPEARPNLERVRELIFAGRFAEAEALAEDKLMGKPIRQMPYQPAADLWLDFDLPSPVADYRHELDLDAAIATTRFSAGDVTLTREVFSTAADGVLVVRLSADKAGALSFALSLTSEQPGSVAMTAAGHLRFEGTNRDAEGIAGRLRFAAEARLLTDGQRSDAADRITVSGATEALILIDVATSFRRFDDVSGDHIGPLEARLDAAMAKSWTDLCNAHLAEHRRLYRRLDIDLGQTAAVDLPTDERIAANVTVADPALAALYVQYGRYLMISSSRPGTQPANLQGIWNDLTSPPWGSKYTANINLQMNYWLPDPANLVECFEPLIAMVEDLTVTGAEMAKAHYGARGWVLHHNTDLWRATGPVDGAKWGLWPTGGAWLCAQLWDHVAYAGDDALVRRVYPLLAGAARFILDVLVPLPGTDRLVIVPSLSPENVHPEGAALAAGVTMDNQLVRDLFDALIDATTRLGADPALAAEAAAARDRLPPHQIGKAGQLMEWLKDWDMEVPEIHHRHVSHLYGLYPSQQISLAKTPELAAAARKTLEIRGDDATGWGIGWRINLWARLGDGNHTHEVVQLLLTPERTYPNMFDAHPPFQIDGNFGGAAGILEMLVQSTGDEIVLLPALPDAWPDGSVKGVRARGGVTVDLSWRDGKLAEASLTAKAARQVLVRFGTCSQTYTLSPTPTVIAPL